LDFNKTLLKNFVKGKIAIAFDPSHILKSGKQTPGVGRFWSGCDNKMKWGLEFCGLAILDLERRTAYHLFGFQTIDLKTNDHFLTFYVRKILEKKEELLKISNYIVADAFFSNQTFIKPFILNGFQVVSRLRDDANLQYIYDGEREKRTGPPRKYDGKVYYKNLNLKYAKLVSEVDDEKIYSLQARHNTFCLNLNLVIVYSKNIKNEWVHKIYFSTDLEQSWDEILNMYRMRFQIEFLYRDAKQFTGLNHCQARSKNKLNFHWNMSLTAINISKILHWIPKKDKNIKSEVVFSMSDVKTQYNNELMLNLFISMFGVNPELAKNKVKIEKFLSYGKIDA
jgi:hypothetical protein